MTVVINGTSGITDVNGTAAAPAITGTDTDTGVFFGTNTVSLSTGGTERLQVDSSGNLGLGVTPSAWNTFKGMQLVGGSLMSFSNAYVDLWQNSYYDGSNVRYVNTGYASYYRQNSGQHQWFTAASGTGGNVATFTQAMTLAASGGLSVGTTTDAGTGNILVPADGKIQGNAASGSGSSSYIELYNSTTGNMTLATRFVTASIAFATGTTPTERARIDSSGNLLVGTTSNSENYHVNIKQNGGGVNGLLCLSTATSGDGSNLLTLSRSYAVNNTIPFLSCGDTGAQRAEIRNNGGIANYQANDVNLSDRREKTNFAPAGDYLAKICAIPVQTFNYIDQNLEEDGGLTLGVVAQDVQAVAPELVTESNWGSEEEPKMRLSIYQTDLQYALMKCIQEQQAIITQLQADVAALKGQA